MYLQVRVHVRHYIILYRSIARLGRLAAVTSNVCMQNLCSIESCDSIEVRVGHDVFHEMDLSIC